MAKENGRKIMLVILLAVVLGVLLIPAPEALAVEYDDIPIDGIKEEHYQEIDMTDNYTLFTCESEDLKFVYIDFNYNISKETIILHTEHNEYNLTTSLNTAFLTSIKQAFTLEFSIIKEAYNNELILELYGLESDIIVSSKKITDPDEEIEDTEEAISYKEGYNIFTLLSDIINNISWWAWLLLGACGTLLIVTPALIAWRIREHPIQEFDVFTGSVKKKQNEKAGRWLREEISTIRGYIAHIYKSSSAGIRTIFSEDNQSDIRRNKWRVIYKIIELYPDYVLTERDLLESEQYDKIYIEHNKRYKYWYYIIKHVPNKRIAMRADHNLKRYRVAVCPFCKNEAKLYVEKLKKEGDEDVFKLSVPFLEGENIENPRMICENKDCPSRSGVKNGKSKDDDPDAVEHIIEKVTQITFLELKINMEKVTTNCDVVYERTIDGQKTKKEIITETQKAIPITTYYTIRDEDKNVVKGSVKLLDVCFSTMKHKDIIEAYKEQTSLTEARNIKAIQLAKAYNDVEILSKENSYLEDVNTRLRATLKHEAKKNILALSEDLTDITDMRKFGHEILYGKNMGLTKEITLERAINKLYSVGTKDEEKEDASGSLKDELAESKRKIKELENDQLNSPFIRNKKRSDLIGE